MSESRHGQNGSPPHRSSNTTDCPSGNCVWVYARACVCTPVRAGVCVRVRIDGTITLACDPNLSLRSRSAQDAKVKGFKVNNMAADGSFGFKVDFQRLQERYSGEHQLSYDPEQFPGLRWSFGDQKDVSCSIFHNGKVTLTGAKVSIDVCRPM